MGVDNTDSASKRWDLFDDIYNIFSMVSESDYVTLYDVKERVTRFSPAVVELAGLPGEYMTDAVYTWSDYIHPDDRMKYENAMSELLAGKIRNYDITYRVRKRNGEYHSFRFTGGMIRGEDGYPGIIGGIMMNIGVSENIDRMTSMRNIQGFFEDISDYGTNLGVEGSLAVMLIGFGRLTHINEIYGYAYGSKLLEKVAGIIREKAKDECDIYRMEGSKFALVAGSEDAEALIKIYEELKETFIKGVAIDNVIHNLVAYGGLISSYNGKQGDEHALRDCLLHAYNESKHYHHGELVMYNGNHMEDLELSGDVAMIGAIRESMKADYDGFYIMYEPVFGKRDENPIGAEALLRWRNEQYGDVEIDRFIAEIEQDNEFNSLGYWLLRRIMTDGTDFLKANPDFFIYTDVMPAQVRDPYFKDTVKEIAHDTGFPLAHLHIGLTRSCRMLDLRLIKSFLASLHEEDILAGLDSFARGNAWLKTFTTVEPDFVRFSSELTKDLKHGEKSRIIMSHLIQMIDACDTDIYIKAIDSEEIKDYIFDLPVRGMQGEYLSKPKYYDEVIEYYDTEDADN